MQKILYALSVMLLTMAAILLFPPKGAASGQAYIFKVADHSTQLPGAVVWSPDGRSIAFISEALVIIDLETRNRNEISTLKPYFLCWGTDNQLYVLYQAEGRKMLTRIDPGTLNRTDFPLPFQPDGIFSLPEQRTMILVAAALDQKRLWSDITYTLHLFDPNSVSTRKIYENRKTLQRAKGTSDYLSGWLWPGPRPGDTTFMTMEPVKPPVLMPYLQLGMVDYITGRSIEAGRIESLNLSVPASWSPDGRRLAFSDLEGILHLYDIEREVVSTPEKGLFIRGSAPAWNPRGSEIYFGGHIIRSDGQQSNVLGPGGRESVGFWSSDGTKIAIAAATGLYIAGNHRPVLVGPDKVYAKEKTAKLRLLKELLAEGLISEQEYGERRDVLMKNME